MPRTNTDDGLEWAAYGAAFGRRLEAVRRARGATLMALGHASTLDKNTPYNLANSRGHQGGNPQMRTVYRLARGLGVSPALLLPSVDDVPAALPREASAAFDWDPFHDEVLRLLQQGRG